MEVLVVDDEPSVRQALQRALAFEGYDVLVAGDGHAALDTLLTHQPDAILLDVAMPGIDGLEVCRRLRAAGDRTPILMLTARHATADRVAGLDAGADDYLVKPFALEELLARLRALLRRPAGGDGPVLARGRLTLDPATREVRAADRTLSLTPREFAMLELLLRRSPAVVSRESLATQVWEDDAVGWNTIEVHIARLRAKLVHAGVGVVAVRGIGYRLVDA